jgi:hypothetical protein
LYSSPNINRANKSRKIKWVKHVAQMEEINAPNTLVGKPEGKRGIDGTIILKLVLNKQDMGCRLNTSGSG